MDVHKNRVKWLQLSVIVKDICASDLSVTDISVNVKVEALWKTITTIDIIGVLGGWGC